MCRNPAVDKFHVQQFDHKIAQVGKMIHSFRFLLFSFNFWFMWPPLARVTYERESLFEFVLLPEIELGFSSLSKKGIQKKMSGWNLKNYHRNVQVSFSADTKLIKKKNIGRKRKWFPWCSRVPSLNDEIGMFSCWYPHRLPPIPFQVVWRLWNWGREY